jgi:hypothetical protein
MSTARKIDRHTFDMVPKALTSRPQWVVWKYARRDGKATKIPYQAASTNELAASNNPATWATLEQAVAAFRDNDDVDGIGYVFAADDPFIGIDFDKCRNAHGGFLPWAERWIAELGGYQEISPSGVGIKAWIRASHPIDRHKVSKLGDGSGAIEVYDQTRFFTVTGQCVGLDTLTDDRTLAFSRLYAEWFPPKAAKAKTEDRPPLIPMLPDDQTLLEKARTASNGSKFRDLYDSGNWQSHYGSQSEADLGLCQLLVFWCGIDPERIDRLFRTSAMFRAKWDGKRRDSTYGEWTIDRAISQASEFYTPGLPDPVEMARNSAKRKASTASIVSKTSTIAEYEDSFANNASSANDFEEIKIDWEPPVDRSLPAVAPFPTEVFPDEIAKYVKAIAKAVQCPIDYVGCTVLGIASGTMGMSVNVKIDEGFVEAANLNIAIVGEPGTRKSPIRKLLGGPVFEIDDRNREIYTEAKRLYEHQLQQWEAEKKGDRGPAPIPPTMVELFVDDATVEGVADVLHRNRRGILIFRDELTAWVNSLNAYRSGGKGADSEFWMSTYTGATYKVTRKGNKNEPIYLGRPCATVCGFLTPESIPTIREKKQDNGWLDRIFFSFPDYQEPVEWSEDRVPEHLIEEWKRIVWSLWNRKMVRCPETGRDYPFIVSFTPEAREAWKEFIKRLRSKKRDKTTPKWCRGPWAKMEGGCGRLALILSQLRQASEYLDDVEPRNITAKDIEDAEKLINYFQSHLFRAREQLAHVVDTGEEDGKVVLAWIRNCLFSPKHDNEVSRRMAEQPEGKKHLTGRDVSRAFGRMDHGRQRAAISWLVKHRYLAAFVRPAGEEGRMPTDIYFINPEIGEE